MRRRTFLAASGAAALSPAAAWSRNDMMVEPGETAVRLWPGEAPGGANVDTQLEVLERGTAPDAHDRAFAHIVTPYLRIMRPANPNGAAMVVAPGGAHVRVVYDKEGPDVGASLAEAGITVAILYYRLMGDGWAAGRDAPLQDAKRALRLVRSGVAGEVDVNRVGFMGFSAGGDLAAQALMRPDEDLYAPVDAADRLSAKADLGGLIYPALDMPVTMKGAAEGTRPDIPFTARVGAQMPPTFVMHAADDPSVPVDRSLDIFAAMQAASVPSEMHIFEEGGHGFGVRGAAGKPAERWPELFIAWAARHGFLSA